MDGTAEGVGHTPYVATRKATSRRGETLSLKKNKRISQQISWL
jgi:hypothetical protein